MKNLLSIIVAVLFGAFSLSSCNSTKHSDNSAIEPEPQSTRSIYYWKTQFSLNADERQFLQTHDISKMYIKMFDIALAPAVDMTGQEIVPVASIRFVEPVPEGIEVVPTVYLTLDALKEMKGQEHACATKVFKRLKAMCDYNSLGTIHEIQMDCDWTASTFPTYHVFCDALRRKLHEENWQLSITIRAHQLSDERWPSADRGVLMLYNTGAFKSPTTTNSILDARDAAPYLKTPKFSRPLALAFPLFSWNLLFRADEFKCIISDIDFSDATLFQKMDDTHYKVLKDTLLFNVPMMSNDLIRTEASDINEIRTVQKKIMKVLPATPEETILYHLDTKCISKFSENEINEIYSAH